MAQLFPWQNIGFEVAAVFTSAREALEYIAHDPVDVVLTDIEMPDMNGLELSRRLMDCPQIEKVFFSSYSNYEYFRTALQNGVADYLITGSWSKKAYKEAKLFGDARVAASTEAEGYTRIPKQDELALSADADYVYLCENETIYGVKFPELPDTGDVPIVADLSSCFLSEPFDITRYGVMYGGVQKNIGPAGVVIAIIREDLIRDDVLPGCPTMLKWKTQADAGSLYNTPPTWGIYVCGLVFKWIIAQGGLAALKERNERKAGLLYDFIDQSGLFKATVAREDRSIMNVPFVTGDADLDAKFVAEAKGAGIVNIKGHRSVGGMRASIYNAMPEEGVRTLVSFMEKFERANG